MRSLMAAAVCATLTLLSSGCTQEQKDALRKVFPDEPLLNKPSNDPVAIAAADTQPGIAAATTRPAPAPPQVVEVTFPASGGAGNDRSIGDSGSNSGDMGGPWMGGFGGPGEFNGPGGP